MTEIPVIDITQLASDQPDGVVAAIDDAGRRYGFFQIVGHGIDPDLIDDVWRETRAFFAMDRAAKLALSRTKENSRGYYDRELTKRSRDLKEVFDFAHVPHPELPDDHPRNFAPVDGHNRWPADRPSFRRTMVAYLDACEGVARRLLRAFAMALDVEPDRFDEYFDHTHTSFIRLNHYPLGDPLDEDEAMAVTDLGDMALHHHSDAGAFTILLQDDVGGLQVEHDGRWLDVASEAGALVVNTGDMMQVWSNDRYRAALHRVRPMAGRERYSLPFFFNPSYATDYAPLLSAPDDPPHYRSINWGAFRQGRADGDFADYGEEIQISQFRLDEPGSSSRA